MARTIPTEVSFTCECGCEPNEARRAFYVTGLEDDVTLVECCADCTALADMGGA
jgi:hypothetical protein